MLEPTELYACLVCGNTMCGMEWDEHPETAVLTNNDYRCPECGHGFTETEFIVEGGGFNGSKND